MTDDIIKAAFAKVLQVYGPEIAKASESISRMETAHFTSVGWQKTLGAGIEGLGKTPTVFPFGWPKLSKFWHDHPEYAPIGTIRKEENDSDMSKSRGVRIFLVFASIEASFMTIAEDIKMEGTPGAWFANAAHIKDREKYAHDISLVIPKFVNQIIKDNAQKYLVSDKPAV